MILVSSYNNGNGESEILIKTTKDNYSEIDRDKFCANKKLLAL